MDVLTTEDGSMRKRRGRGLKRRAKASVCTPDRSKSPRDGAWRQPLRFLSPSLGRDPEVPAPGKDASCLLHLSLVPAACTHRSAGRWRTARGHCRRSSVTGAAARPSSESLQEE